MRDVSSVREDVLSLSDFMREKSNPAGEERRDLPAVARYGVEGGRHNEAQGLLSGVKSRVRFPDAAGGFTVSNEWMVLGRGLHSRCFAGPGDSGSFVLSAMPAPRVLGMVVGGRCDQLPPFTYVSSAGELFASMQEKLGASEMRVATAPSK